MFFLGRQDDNPNDKCQSLGLCQLLDANLAELPINLILSLLQITLRSFWILVCFYTLIFSGA